jgi:hypothetical protein
MMQEYPEEEAGGEKHGSRDEARGHGPADNIRADPRKKASRRFGVESGDKLEALLTEYPAGMDSYG